MTVSLRAFSLFTLFLLLVPLAVLAGNVTYGTWGHGAVTSLTVEPLLPVISGYDTTFSWYDVEPSKDVFDWTTFDGQLNLALNYSLSVGFILWVGPNSPSWIYCPGENKTSATCVPRVYTDDPQHRADFYPYYLDSYYTARYYNLLHNVSAHLATHPEWQGRLLYWMSAEGSTGDEGPYKGNPTSTLHNYTISDDIWTEYRRDAWTLMFNDLQQRTPYIQLMVNQGNDGGSFDWALANLPCAWMKAGDVSHSYSFIGELNYFNRLSVLDASATGCNRVRGEFEATYLDPVWQKSPLANTLMLVLSSLTIGLDMLDIRQAGLSQNTPDLSPWALFNKYAGIRGAASFDKAFVYLRDVIDIADVLRFPESLYGPLIAPASFQQYNRSVIRIMQDSSIDPAAKADRITDLKVRYINPARVTALVNEFQSQGAQFTSLDYPREQVYDMDFGIDMIPDNYQLFMKQLNPAGTSIGRWRVASNGTDGSKYGRYARSFDASHQMTQMTFDIDDALDGGLQLTKVASLAVTYYDSGNDVWGVRFAASVAGSGQEYLLQNVTVTNKNTQRWQTSNFTLEWMALVNAVDYGDFSIYHISGGDTVFSLIEFQVIEGANQTDGDGDGEDGVDSSSNITSFWTPFLFELGGEPARSLAD